MKDVNIDFDVNLLSNSRYNDGVSSGVTSEGFKVREKKVRLVLLRDAAQRAAIPA